MSTDDLFHEIDCFLKVEFEHYHDRVTCIVRQVIARLEFIRLQRRIYKFDGYNEEERHIKHILFSSGGLLRAPRDHRIELNYWVLEIFERR